MKEWARKLEVSVEEIKSGPCQCSLADCIAQDIGDFRRLGVCVHRYLVT